MRKWAVLGLCLFATNAWGAPESEGLRYAHFTHPAGSKIVYVDVRRHWMEQTIVDGLKERRKHLGVLAINLETYTGRYEPGREFSQYRSHDALGWEFYDDYLGGGDDEPLREGLIMRDPSGTKHVLRTEIGNIENVAVTIQNGTAWVFYLRTVSVGTTGKRSGEWAVARVNADTREATYLPYPPCGPKGTWDWLVAQNKDIVFLTGGRRGGQAQTWRGDFDKQRWAQPIRGDFVVIDAKGTLIERRDSTTWAREPRLLPTQAEMITEGTRTTIDLGLSGRIQPLFGSGRVVLFDPTSKRYVLRSVTGAPDRWLPVRPPLKGRFELDSE